MSKSRLFLAPAVAIVLLAGCGGDTPENDPYLADLQNAQRQATSPFERDVFEDLSISRGEYEEAVTRFVDCVRERGVNFSKRDQNGYFVYQVSGSTGNVDAIQDQCRVGTIALIEPIYVDKLRNPQKQSWDDITAGCLVRKGLAPQGYSGSDYQRDKKTNFSSAPFNPEDQRNLDCTNNPSA